MTGAERFCTIDRGAVVIQAAARLVPPNQPVGVMQLKFMRIGGERSEIADPVVAGAGSEYGVECECA